MYVDPPYFNADMGHYDGYSEHDFIQLLEMLSAVKGKFLLSSYPSELLSGYVERHGWQQANFDKYLSAAKEGRADARKTEVLTSNYHPERTQLQCL